MNAVGMSGLSGAGAVGTNYAAHLRASLAAKAQSSSSAAAPMDSDGDHDGSKPGETIDVKA